MIKEFPQRIVIEMTPQCNLSCSMCPRHYINENDGYMSEMLYRKIIDEISYESPETIVLPFWRGESCMHPQFISLLNYTFKKKLKVHLSTNGHYMDDKVRNIFYRCEFITFSIHDNRGYKNATKFIKEKPAWSESIAQISFVDVEKTTQKFLKECVGSPALNGFDSVRLYREHTIGGEFGNSGQYYESNRRFCPKLEHTFVISADGKYSRCNHIWEPELSGNLEGSSIKEIWRSERMNEIREKYPDNKCAPCDQWSGHTNGESWKKENNQVIHINHSALIDKE